MLGQEALFDVLETMMSLKESGIEFHCQIVLCPGYNDGDVLAKTLLDLAGLGDSLLSLAVVPVGLTRHRDHLPVLRQVDKGTAQAVIDLINRTQASFLKSLGRRIVFAADEFFIQAELPIPPEEYYENFAQLENGIGLIRKTLNQTEELAEMDPIGTSPRKVLLVTGVAAAPTLSSVAAALQKVFPSLEISVQGIVNRFLGSQITVAGLLAGADVLRHVQGYQHDWNVLVIPGVAVRPGCFIDDYTPKQLAQILDKPVLAPADVPELVKLLRNEGI